MWSANYNNIQRQEKRRQNKNGCKRGKKQQCGAQTIIISKDKKKEDKTKMAAKEFSYIDHH